MNRRIGFAIAVCFFLSIGAVALLFALSGEMRDRHNSFLRQFPPHPVIEDDTLNIRYAGYYIAGGTASTLYLGNAKAPLHVLQIPVKKIHDTTFINLKIDSIRKQKFWFAKVQVDSPYYYLTDGVIPVIYQGSIQTGDGVRQRNDSVFFQDIVAMSAGSFALRSVSSRSQENMLGTFRLSPPKVHFDDQLLTKQFDGIFCTDGMLNYDRGHHRLAYLYFYRNEFTVMDTTLRLLYRANTIDTNTVAKIKPATVESTHERMLASPANYVNKRSCISDGMLFVQSALLARNEPAEALKETSVIDVYDLADGSYRFSFYIFDFNGRKMTDFKVYGNTMAVLFGRTLQLYHLRPKIFHPSS